MIAIGWLYKDILTSTVCESKTGMIDENVQKRLIRQWRVTGRLLRKIRRDELAAMRDEESRGVVLHILNLASVLSDDPRRECNSGLVDMQRLFSKLRERITA